MANHINVIGAGLAGCEAANIITKFGIPVKLYEMKPSKFSAAHKNPKFAELVCSNSLKSNLLSSATGLLKAEMRLFDSICLSAADFSKVEAGQALAVDRDIFSDYITKSILSNDLIEVHNIEVKEISKDEITVIATGPVGSKSIENCIKNIIGTEFLNFYDAVAPIVSKDSLDFDNCFYASRYNKGEADYINCPLSKEQYALFYNELINAEKAKLSDDDIKVYEGCMPIEKIASRGFDTMRFGPLKPVGLIDPKTNTRPFAVIQLRSENKENSMYNLVGFQTNLKFGEQKRVFSLIPALRNAEFFRYGVMHRNTFLNSPKILNNNLSLKLNEKVFFAGQLTGVEGYMESASSGIISGLNAAMSFLNKELILFPRETVMGALQNYVTQSEIEDFQPMGANFGILPPLNMRIKDKKERYNELSNRSLEIMKGFSNNVKNLC